MLHKFYVFKFSFSLWSISIGISMHFYDDVIYDEKYKILEQNGWKKFLLKTIDKFFLLQQRPCLWK